MFASSVSHAMYLYLPLMWPPRCHTEHFSPGAATTVSPATPTVWETSKMVSFEGTSVVSLCSDGWLVPIYCSRFVTV